MSISTQGAHALALQGSRLRFVLTHCGGTAAGTNFGTFMLCDHAFSYNHAAIN